MLSDSVRSSLQARDLSSRNEYALVPEEDIDLPSTNDLVVLEAMGDAVGDSESKVSFQGIRRRLGVHQETLSRALHRLERDGFVQKQNREYKLSSKGEHAISQDKSRERPINEAYSVPILRTMIPPGVDIFMLVTSLSHRWFGSLRWYGSSRSEESITLWWVTDDGKTKLSARIAEGFLTIESQANTLDSMSGTVRAAYEIFDHVSRILKAPQISSRRPSMYGAA
jgi:MarR family